jgi:2-C-methyl-D-erythritol 2,4-cyclodiphosphate synthase
LNSPYRIGIGFDVHAFADNRKLIIGGVNIPFEKGLTGHSDADVLLHAICDAFLGSISAGDIGHHFPDTDPIYKNADSMDLLKRVYELVQAKGFVLGNVDAVITAQRPKLAEYIPLMQLNISKTFQTEIENVSIKATTTERLGFVGREEGISAFASVIIIQTKQNA